MSQRLSHPQLCEPGAIERSFGRLTVLFGTMLALYLAFVGGMAGLFLKPELATAMVVFAAFVVVPLGLAGWWSTAKPAGSRALSERTHFHAQGIDIPGGWLTAGEANLQVLLLPVLIVGWGLGAALVVALAAVQA